MKRSQVAKFDLENRAVTPSSDTKYTVEPENADFYFQPCVL